MQLIQSFFGLLGMIVAFLMLPTSTIAVGVDHVWYKQQSDGTVLQTIQITAPAQVYKLTFAYCNGQTCGNPLDPELDCYVNKYNPSFPAPPRALTITPPPGSTANKIFLKAGSLPGFTGSYGYYDPGNPNDWNSNILDLAPTFGSNGSVTFNFNQPSFMNGLPERAPSGRICGLTEEQYRAFQNQYGTENDENFYKSYFKIGIIWSPPSSSGSVIYNVDLDGQKRDDYWVYVKQQSKTPVKPLSADNSQQFLSDAFSKNGTIPTLVASLLGRLGALITPNDLALALEKAGVASKNGLSWTGLSQYINNFGTKPNTYSAADVTAAEALRAAAGGQTYLTTMTVQTKDGKAESSVFLTGYDASSDRVRLLTAEGKTIKLSTQDYLKGQPWIMEIQLNQ